MFVLRASMAVAVLAAALSAGATWPAAAAGAAEPIAVDARLSQRVLKEGATNRIYLRIAVKGVKGERAEARTPANIALVVDRSGSMQGEKIRKAREAAIMAVERLSATDHGAVVVFDNAIDVLVPSTRVASHAIFRDRIAEVTARGSTAIYAAVQEAAREIRKSKSPARLNRIILMSDGLANVGPSSPADFQKLGRDLGSEGISVTTIGLGDGYNEDLMARLANASDGSHAFARTASDLTRIFNQEFDEVLSVTAQDIEILIETRSGVRPVKPLGREAEIVGNRATFKLAQAYGTAEYSLQLELEVPAEAARGDGDLATVRVAYRSGADGVRRVTTATVAGRFSASERDATDSIDPDVMAPIVELESRARREKAVELRDKGQVDAARAAFAADAEAIKTRRDSFKFTGDAKVRAEALEAQSREAARQVGDEASWQRQRKIQRELGTNAIGAIAPGAPSGYKY